MNGEKKCTRVIIKKRNELIFRNKLYRRTGCVYGAANEEGERHIARAE